MSQYSEEEEVEKTEWITHCVTMMPLSSQLLDRCGSVDNVCRIMSNLQLSFQKRHAQPCLNLLPRQTAQLVQNAKNRL